MKNEEYIYVADFSNETKKDMSLYLEMTCEEVVLSPGHIVRLMAENNPEFYPLDILYCDSGIQVYPKSNSPNWKIEFNGKQYEPQHPTVLKELE